MKKTTTFLLVLALAIALFSAKAAYADTATGSVGITNVAPTVGTVTLWNQAGEDAAITLTAGSTVTVIANATVTDLNGGANIASAAATLYHSTSTYDGAADENIHLANGTCVLGSAVGNNKVATCSFTMNYMALPGTWTANITGTDGSSATGSNTDPNTVNSLVGVDVTEDTVSFSTMALGTNSTAGSTATVQNTGNVQMDAQFSGTDYACTIGTIDKGNTKYSVTDGTYDDMSDALTGTAATDADFDLGVRGVTTANGANSTDTEYFTILIPTSGVSGTCTDTITIGAVAG